jgi:beta-glucuronidase
MGDPFSRSCLRLLVAGCLALLALPAPAGAADGLSDKPLYRDGQEGRLLVGGTWLFRRDAEDQGLAAGFATNPAKDGWSEIRVPFAWNAGDDSPESQRGGVAWYRKDFRVPAELRGRSFVVRFESVNYRATVFLNGRELGSHEGASIPFELPASGLDRTGVNRLVVRTDSRRSDTDLPPMSDSEVTGLPGGGWWNYGGLLREVYLRSFDSVDVEQLLARPQLDCRSCDAGVLVRATLRNATRRRVKVRFEARVGGQAIEPRTVSIAGGRTREVRAKLTLRDPKLWELGRPYLYPVRAEVSRKGRTLSAYSTHVGVRSFDVDPTGRLLLNDRRVRLRGASLHEDDPAVGAALTPRKLAALFADLEALGANFTRAHYPLNPQLLEMADRRGVLVWDQVPLYRIRESTMVLRSVRDKGVRYLRDTIARDQNHASVLAFSVANELSRTPGPGQTAYLAAAVKVIEREDPTRLTAIDIAGYPSVRLVRQYRQFDALGTNAYFGWYPGPSGSVLNREVLGPYLDQLHEYYPRQGLFVTEFGAEANRDGPADEKGTFAYQSGLVAYHLGVYDSKSFINGALVWLLRDFKVRPGWDGYNDKPEPPYNKKGLIDQRGVRKPAFFVAARNFKR